MKKLLRTVRLTLDERTITRRRKRLEAQIARADEHRAKGVMASLSRGSLLLHLEQVHTGPEKT